MAILLTGQGLQGTLIPTRAALENFSTVTIGVIGASYFLGFTIGCLRGGMLLRSVGHVRVFAAMTAAASAAPLILGLWAEPWTWEHYVCGLYVFSGAVHLSLFGYVGIRALERLPVPTEQQSDFGDALTIAQTASAVYEADRDNEGLPDAT